tara:strand:- start:384 stop:509 length:126 start_codon:yes stop_codon:yes gene_type:complete
MVPRWYLNTTIEATEWETRSRSEKRRGRRERRGMIESKRND